VFVVFVLCVFEFILFYGVDCSWVHASFQYLVWLNFRYNIYENNLIILSDLKFFIF